MTASKSRKTLLLLVCAPLALLVGFDRWQRSSGDAAGAPAHAASSTRSNVAMIRSSPVNAKRPRGETRRKPATLSKPAAVPNPLASLTRDRLRATVLRPLFSPSRAAFRAPVMPAKRKPPPRRVVRAPPTPNTFVALGIIMAASTRIAVLYDKAKTRSSSVRQGDKLGLWRVVRIDSQSVTLQQRGRSVVLRVFSKNLHKQLEE